MIPGCITILIILALFSGLQGFLTLAQAQSSMHQIYGAAWWTVFAVSVGGIGTMYAVWSLTDYFKQIRRPPDKKTSE